MLEPIDPFALKEKFDLFNILRQELGDLHQDLRFLAALRRAFLPIAALDQPTRPPLFPELVVEPHPLLAGKRVGLVISGGSGALVALCGVKRALEEAAVEVAAVSVCSGSAIWGSMIAAGLSAKEMVDASFRWRTSDLVDLDWGAVARLALPVGRGFTGLMRGEAIERTMDRLFGGLTLASTKLPCYANVINFDTNEMAFIGPHNQPGMTLARLVRHAIALPLFVQPVPLGDHLFGDGGVVDIFPLEALLRFEAAFDYLIGVNVIMPPGFRGEDITGFAERPLAIIRASRQLYHTQWLELARKQIEKAGDRFLLLEPVPYAEITGTKFFDVFFDNQRWPSLIEQGYRNSRKQLAACRRGLAPISAAT